MGCNSMTLAGLDARCDKSIGGVKKVFVALASETDTITANEGKVGITLGEGGTWYKYQFRPNTASYTTTATFNEQGGSYWTSEVAMVFAKMDTAKRIEINALAQSTLRIAVEDANGIIWVLGTEFEAQASAMVGQTGTAFSDANNYSVTLQAVSIEAPMEADAEFVATLKAL